MRGAYTNAMTAHLEASKLPVQTLINDFPKYANNHQLSRFLARYELMKMILDVPGSIIELGAQNGAGVLAFARLSMILEMRGGVYRMVYGFDTFEGLPTPSEHDGSLAKPGDMPTGEEVFLDLIKSAELAAMETGIPKIQLYKGDFMETGPRFLQDHPEAIISLLFCDFALYEPTQLALKLFQERMPKGGVIVFEGLGKLGWPGETKALMEWTDLDLKTIRKFPWHTTLSYIVL